jgi:sialate O-acetylesterase
MVGPFMRFRLTLIAFLGLGVPVDADVVPAPLFTDNAVLQRDRPIPVWGTADAGEDVAVTFGASTVATKADASGRWRIDLPAQPANAAPSELVIKGNSTLVLGNIVVGEVWLASGQSNMEWPVNKTFGQAIDVPASARFPVSNSPAKTGALSQPRR